MILLTIIAGSAIGQDNVLQVFNGHTYKPLNWNDIERLSFNPDDKLTLIQLSEGETIGIPFDEMSGRGILSGSTIPLIEITTDEELTEIPDKINYKTAVINLRGFGNYDDVDTEVNIRGRGNTSWGFPKKPYRLKFSKKISLCGLRKAKNYVLLACYSDASLMQYALACRIARMLDMPFAPEVVPVDVVLNGSYKGSYILCNKPGINAGSVDIDENTSIMWELDVAYDEEYKFRSPVYDVPVQAVDPDLDDERFRFWQDDFIEMEKAVYELNGADYIDMDEFAKYLLVYDILNNNELEHPKSVKLYKTEGGKYIFGPVWDFDWSMGSWGYSGVDTGNYTIFNPWPYPVRIHPFLERVLQHPEARAAIRNHWLDLSGKLNELYEFIDRYAATIRASAIRDKRRWDNQFDFDNTCSMMKSWLKNHIEAMNNFDYLKP